MTGNTVYGQSTTGAIGIRIENSQDVSGNLVYGNATGVSGGTQTGTLNNNRIYNNTTGVSVDSELSIVSNSIYSNSTGVRLASGFNVTVLANLIYANTNTAVLINPSVTGNSGTRRQLIGNSIYHSVGNAIQLSGGAKDATLSNNVIQIQAGNAISVATDSQAGLLSNNNLIYRELVLQTLARGATSIAPPLPCGKQLQGKTHPV